MRESMKALQVTSERRRPDNCSILAAKTLAKINEFEPKTDILDSAEKSKRIEELELLFTQAEAKCAE